MPIQDQLAKLAEPANWVASKDIASGGRPPLHFWSVLDSRVVKPDAGRTLLAELQDSLPPMHCLVSMAVLSRPPSHCPCGRALRPECAKRKRDGIEGWLRDGIVICLWSRVENVELNILNATPQIREELRRRRHDDRNETAAWLGRVINGWLNYYAVPGSGRYLGRFIRLCQRLLWRALRRRSQRDRTAWEKIDLLVAIHWPKARIRHPWPDQRLVVNTQGRSPVR